jgi:transposase
LTLHGIDAPVEHGLSNSRLGGTNTKVRLMNRRGHGHPEADHLATMVHLWTAHRQCDRGDAR